MHLRVDHSTGTAREDLPEYYEEVDVIMGIPPNNSDFQ